MNKITLAIKSLLQKPTTQILDYLHDLYEERAGIFEYEANKSRAEAERLAFEEIERLCKAKNEGYVFDKSPPVEFFEADENAAQPPYWKKTKVIDGMVVDSKFYQM